MENGYIEQRDGGYWVKGTRISLDSIVLAFNRGAAPESIKRSFPLLSLEEVYGAITFYLSHEQEINDYLAQSEAILDAESRKRNARARAAKPELFDRLEKARQEREPSLKMKVRFQADADLDEDIIAGVIRREPEIDFQTATEANLRGLFDEDVLAIAARENRVLVSHDRRTSRFILRTSSSTKIAPAFLSIKRKTHTYRDRSAGSCLDCLRP